MRRLLLLIAASAGVLGLPAVSAAQGGYLAPHIGWDFGGSAGNCPSFWTDCQEKRMNYGVAFGTVGVLLGIEGDVSYAPNFFGESQQSGTAGLLTAMGNLVVNIPAGPVRPFATAGIGLIRTRLDLLGTSSAGSVDTNDVGYNVGGGVMVFLPAHLGIRGDIRYFRTFSDLSILGIGINNSPLTFTRLTLGVVIH